MTDAEMRVERAKFISRQWLKIFKTTGKKMAFENAKYWMVYAQKLNLGETSCKPNPQ